MAAERALVTGASGYLGGAIAAALAGAGWEVLTAGRKADSSMKMDFSDPSSVLNHAALRAPVVMCVHAAAAHEVVCGRDPLLAMTVNVLGTRALVEWCVAQKIKRFVYVSTFHVFGDNHGDLTETVAPRPLNDYGLTHLLAEEVALTAGRRAGMEVRILRPSNLIGTPAQWESFDRWTLAPFDFCRQAAESGRIVLRSSGRQTRNWVGIDALCASVLNLSGEGTGSCLHLSGGDLSIIGLAQAVAESWQRQFGREITVFTGDGAGESPEPSRKFFSVYQNAGIFPNIHEFVQSVGSHLLQNHGKSAS